MRIRAIQAKNVPPVIHFVVEDLSDTVVLAGRNGVGKTRLIQDFLTFFQNPTRQGCTSMIIESTCKEEIKEWGKGRLDTRVQADAQLLQQTLQKNRRRRNLRSSVINFEDNRTIQQVAAYPFTWDIIDPDDEDIGWNSTFSGLQGRWQDTLHSIFRKVQSHVDRLGRRAIKLDAEGKKVMPLKLNDPLDPFRIAFRQLVAPKELTEADLKQQTLFYTLNGTKFNINTLSAGEREVVNVVFDFILRKPSNCIVMFDEPELHLHPELSHKLIQTLKRSGENNQFIFCTHSPDIITATLDSSVIFLGPPKEDGTNQAIPVTEDDETNQALRLLGQSVGIIALGKKIVLIEGTHTSLDKQLYGSIIEERFPSLVLVPSSGKSQISSLSTVIDDVLKRSIWGVDFFMLCDRDAVSPIKDKGTLEDQGGGRLRILDKYHVENYFLNETVLAEVFNDQEEEGSWFRDPVQVRAKMRELAEELVSYTLALYAASHFREQVGNVDIMPKSCDKKSVEELIKLLRDKASDESGRVVSAIEDVKIEDFVTGLASKLEKSLAEDTEDWKSIVPGRPLLAKFASAASIPVDRLKRSYIKHAAQATPTPFQNIIDIFDEFSRYP